MSRLSSGATLQASPEQDRDAGPTRVNSVSSSINMTNDTNAAEDGAAARDAEQGAELPANAGKAEAPAVSDKDDTDVWLVGWDGDDDPEHPLNNPAWRKWAMTIILAASCVSVTCCSSMSSSTYTGMMEEYHVGEEVCILAVSLFVAGLGVGPLFLGPCSEFVGRAKVLHYSYALFFLFNFPVAFANNIAVHLIFRFFTGFVGSAFLTVSGGVVTDTFHNEKVGTPMMVFSSAPFIGPVLGPLIAGFINQHTYWRWTFYVVIIWSAVMMALIITLVHETHAAEILRRKARKLRKTTQDERWISPVEKLDRTFLAALKKSVKTPFILLSTQLMVLFLDLWSALILGILYLSFGGVPYIFRTQHGFNLEQTGMSFLGIGIGQVIAAATQPYFNRKYRDVVKASGGKAPPEARLHMGFFGAVLGPFGLLMMGLLSFKSIHWIAPIIFSSFFGMGMVYSFSSTFTYLVDAYRPVSASALASNSFMRSAFAAGFPLFGQQLYKRLGAVGGTCLLAGLLFLATPLPFVFHHYGPRIRARTQFAAS